MPEPFPAPPITTDPAEVAFEKILAGGGATLPRRDSADVRLMEEIRSGHGRIIDSQKEVGGQSYGVVTLHRPSNVDTREALGPLVEALLTVAQRVPLVFAVHPRTRKKLQEFGLMERLTGSGTIRAVDPLGYIQFMNLVTGARVVVTDSGGVQEETTYRGIPCLTLRENTERPVTVTEGSNKLVAPEALVGALDAVKVTIDRKAINTRMDEKFSDLMVKTPAHIPGFPPGKAPKKIVQKKFFKEVAGEVRTDMAQV